MSHQIKRSNNVPPLTLVCEIVVSTNLRTQDTRPCREMSIDFGLLHSPLYDIDFSGGATVIVFGHLAHLHTQDILGIDGFEFFA